MECLPYREWIDTECHYQDATKRFLPLKGIRIDGEGQSLKHGLGLGSAKSCDYFRFLHQRAFLIECSDLSQQRIQLEKLYKTTEDAMIIAEHPKGRDKKKILKTLRPEPIIRSELKNKCLNTLLILHRLLESKGLSVKDKFAGQLYFVVALCQESQADVIAFQALESQLKQDLSPQVVKTVKVIPAQAVPRLVNIR